VSAAGLSHLCEFIEDCEFTYLSTQILHLVGIKGPKTSQVRRTSVRRTSQAQTRGCGAPAVSN
jgi:predicted RecB family nuclease